MNQGDVLTAIGRPPAGPRDDGLLVLDGYLLRGPGRAVRLVTGHLCIDFHEADLARVEEHQPPEGTREGFAIAVRLFLQRGARVLNIYPSSAYAGLVRQGHSPFAVSSRRARPALSTSPRFRALEEAFLERHGLTGPAE